MPLLQCSLPVTAHCRSPCVLLCKACSVLQVGEETVSDKNSGILTINATGVIQMANKVATQLLG